MPKPNAAQNWDAFAQISVGETLHGIKLHADELLRTLESHGIQRALVSALKPRDYDLASANAQLAAAVNDQPALIGLARVDPWQGERAIKSLDDGIRSLGLAGIHLAPWEENFAVNSPVVEPLLKYAETRDLPVRIAAGYPVVSEPTQILAVARKFSDVRFLISHCGTLDNSGMGTEAVLRLAKATANTWFETSMTYRRDLILQLVNEAGPYRVCFGSSLPKCNIAVELERVKSLEVDNDARSFIMGQSLVEFIGFEP